MLVLGSPFLFVSWPNKLMGHLPTFPKMSFESVVPGFLLRLLLMPPLLGLIQFWGKLKIGSQSEARVLSGL